MLSVANNQEDMREVYMLDSVRLDKVVKALMFVSGHIRQIADLELANRIETSVYEVLLSAHKGKTEYDRISMYVTSLLSIAIDKQYMAPNTIEVFKSGLGSVFSKRQNSSEYETHLSSIFEGVAVVEALEDKRHDQRQIASAQPSAHKAVEVTQEGSIKKDKVQFVAKSHKLDDKRQSERRQEILRTLSATPVSIKDISMHVLGCSEKTIQRELNNLVDDGLVERVGEKRWSKYIVKR